jgi:hypothetical protein
VESDGEKARRSPRSDRTRRGARRGTGRRWPPSGPAHGPFGAEGAHPEHRAPAPARTSSRPPATVAGADQHQPVHESGSRAPAPGPRSRQRRAQDVGPARAEAIQQRGGVPGKFRDAVLPVAGALRSKVTVRKRRESAGTCLKKPHGPKPSPGTSSSVGPSRGPRIRWSSRRWRLWLAWRRVYRAYS